MTCQLLVPLPLLLKYKLIISYFQCTWSSARMFFIFSLHTFLSPSLSLNLLLPFAPSLSSPPHIFLSFLTIASFPLTSLAYLRTVAVTCVPMPASWVTSSMRTPMAASCGSSTTATSSWLGQEMPTLSGTQPRWRKETTLWNCRCVCQIYPILWSNVAFLEKIHHYVQTSLRWYFFLTICELHTCTCSLHMWNCVSHLSMQLTHHTTMNPHSAKLYSQLFRI